MLKNKTAKIFAGVVGITMALSLAVAPSTAGAQTIAELQAQITALQALIAQLSGTVSVSTTFTVDLTVGSTGSDVVALQSFLEARGFLTMPAGVAKGYFGALTKAALAAYQASEGISPAVGYFGPITRANVNAKVSVTPAVPTPGTPGATPAVVLKGGAGSIDDADFVSGLSNEQVGEDEDDVEVAGLEIEADGSDIEIVAVNLDFDQVSASEDFDDYAKNVSIWLDGEKFGEWDASDFEDDDNFDKTVTLDAGAIIRDGETGDLVVAVSGVSNLDSTDAGDTWTVIFTSVRFRDASGAVITESTQGDIGTETRQFSFETFATAADSKLVATIDDDSPDSMIVNIDDTNDTDRVELLSFELEAEGDSNLRIRDLPITFTVTGATQIQHVINTAYVTIDGVEFSENITSTVAAASITFDDFDHTISAGDTVKVVVEVDINDLDTNLDEGDTIKAEYTASNRNVADVEDESGEDLASGDRTGAALGNVMALYDVAPQVTLVSIEEATTVTDGADNDAATFTIKYTVKAIDGDIYVSDTATATTATDITAATVASNMVLYRVDKAGTATTADLSDGTVVSFTSDGNRVCDTCGGTAITNGVKIVDGSTGSFTLTVVRQNSGDADDSGSFRAALKGISWATTDTATQNVYDFDLEDYESDYVTIN